MDAGQPLGRLAAHRVGDGRAHVAALGGVAVIAEAAYELRPRSGDAADVPAGLRRLGREAVAGHGRQHDVERVRGGAAVRGQVGERADDLEQLEDRTGPAVRDDQRQRACVRRLHVDEVDVFPVDLGGELRQRVRPRLARAPVVLGRPVAGELPDRRQLHPCDRSATSSLPGQRVAAMRRRRSAIASPGMSTRKERISLSLDTSPTSLGSLTTADDRLRPGVPGQRPIPAPAD